MKHLKKRGGRVVISLVVLVALMVAVIPVGVAVASASEVKACTSAQIEVSAGATLDNTTYPVKTSTGVHRAGAFEAVPVYFYNRGAACHLLMGAPVVQAVRNTMAPASAPAHDLSISAGADNTRRPVVGRHQKLKALFVVVEPVGSSFKGCDATTTTGFLVTGYATPIAVAHFIVRTLRDVCFDTGAGSHVLDFGVVWPAK